MNSYAIRTARKSAAPGNSGSYWPLCSVSVSQRAGEARAWVRTQRANEGLGSAVSACSHGKNGLSHMTHRPDCDASRERIGGGLPILTARPGYLRSVLVGEGCGVHD